MSDYGEFLLGKRRVFDGHGVDVSEADLPTKLYPFQQALTRWALRKGRAALWADTGLGKTLMQVAWADKIPGRVLILAPLCVSQQTIREAAKIDIEVSPFGVGGRIETLNYERLHYVQPDAYEGIVLDESSILKSLDGKTRTKLIQMFRQTPYRLCCTATPAPNDIAELANHCEFLDVMTRAEMLATFFVHDDEGWRLRGHAREAFYRWLASWGMFVRLPSDLGFSDEGFILPPLETHETILNVDGFRLGTHLRGIRGRLQARRESLTSRVEQAAKLICGTHGQWIAWCGLNDEQDLLADLVGDEAVSISGVDDLEDKEQKLSAFLSKEARVLITKARIAGFGLNLQQCSQMIFVGLSDSFESYYQTVRRCWRFGQTKPVYVEKIISSGETAVLANLQRKEAEHEAMITGLVQAVRESEKEEIGATKRQREVLTREVERAENWTMHLGDCVEVLAELPEASVDLSVYSPPFLALYTYTASERDVGNCSSREEFLEHFGYAVRGLLRVTKPGRLTCCHVSQVASTKSVDGVIGLIDLRGAVIECFARNGWVYHGDICIDKDPQVQAVRTHAKGLLFVQLGKDASWLRPALADYLLAFRVPGENAVPIHPDISNEDWIAWARPVWYGIRETNTLNAAEARTNDADDRHICPLQLDVIERCIRLWSNPNETILDPFAGIGSTGYEAVRLKRRFVGSELKREYFETAIKNLRRAESQLNLFAEKQPSLHLGSTLA